MALLDVDNLSVTYGAATDAVVTNVSFSVQRGEALGIVGESGAGKTQTAMAVMGLLPANASTSGSVRFDGDELLGAGTQALNAYRPQRMAMVFQDPMAALNPYVRIGDQLSRILIEHRICGAREARQRTLAMLRRVGLPDAERQYRSYSYQLSGGMRQRAMIGAALLSGPELLVADEPTTALDVTVQAQILNLLRELRVQSETALLLITHDLGVVAGNCERMLVMDSGQLLEEGTTKEVFASPLHERTASLLDAIPRIDRPVLAAPLANDTPVVLQVENIAVNFKVSKTSGSGTLRAVNAFNLSLAAAETVAIVGESGSGKTSLARAILGLIPAHSGRVCYLGKPLKGKVQSRKLAAHRALQMVFQDPLTSLNPAMRIDEIVAEPIRIHEPRKNRAQRSEDVHDVLQRVGLGVELHTRYPHELSGGQAQRVAIARALVLRPSVLVCDEAVAALDGTVQYEILQVLQAEQERAGLSLIFITHDLAVVRQISHRVLVMYMGQTFELAENDAVFQRPRHPYTKMLINAVPVPDPTAKLADVGSLDEAPASPGPGAGCPFQPRCEHAIAICSDSTPELADCEGTLVACHRAAELDLSY
jgi:oligopeptide/dipeptide ABC transporter ATP-binding protein